MTIFILSVLYRPQCCVSLNCGNAEQKAASPAETAGSALLCGDWNHEDEQSFSLISLSLNKKLPVNLFSLSFFPARKVYSSGKR